MKILSNVPLRDLHTFHINVQARSFLEVSSEEEVREAIALPELKKMPLLILGGGSNILFTGNYDGLILRNKLQGIEVTREDETFYYVRAGAGVNWHQFVLHCIGQSYAGIENLSLIPGNVGASPMQNIGAYGVEVKDVIENVEAIEISSGQLHVFSNKDCEFDYRSSIFKTRAKGQFIITAVNYRLNKQPVYQISYGAIKEELEKMGVQELNIRDVSKAVCQIRSSKLPDPNKLGNAGSFFKNPLVPVDQLRELQAAFPDIPSYKVSETFSKVAAGWLIEQCGWKGKRTGECGVHTKQALVLVNYGNATGAEIYQLSQDILDSVKERFGIELEREVNII